jgi:signal transduction histidine kinase
MKRLMSHGHAIRSTLAFFRVTHFMPFLYSQPVGALLLSLQLATQAAFVLLALAALVDWIRHRDMRRGHLALAFGSLTALSLLSPALGHAGAFNQVLTGVAIAVFLLSGYALLMLRSLTQRIASLEKVKTEFLNVASHELRGPMTVIKGYLTMLEAGSLGDLSTQSRSVLPLLIAKSDEVNWMVDQMVEAARLEEGRLPLKKLPADLVALTDLAIAGVSQLLSTHQVSVDRPAQAIEADVDPDRFQIVVRNLLRNAAKYSPAGARIRVRVSGNGVGRVAVTDEGIGIAEEDQARLFTRFVRIETKSAAPVSGTGLGLWLSREIARMHDGDLTVESTLGQGSTFTLQLPLNP